MSGARWQKAIRDLWLNKTRSLLVCLSIAVGVFAVGSTVSIQANLQRDLQRSYKASHPKSAVISAAPFDSSVVAAVRQMPEVRDAEGRTALSVRVADGAGGWQRFELQAIPSFEATRIDTVYSAGGAWPPGTGELLLERASLPYLPGAEQGGTVQIKLPGNEVRELKVTGFAYDASRFPAPLSQVPAGYISMETLAWLGEETGFNQLLFTVAGDPLDGSSIRQAADRIQDAMRALGAQPAGFFMPPPGKHVADSAVATLMLLLGALGAASLVLSGFLIHNTISAMLGEQVRIIGAMKAVGATRAQLVAIYLGMVLLLCGAAFVLALPVTWLVTRAMVAYLGTLLNAEQVSRGIPLTAVLLQLAVSLVVPLLSALLPVLSGTRVTVREALSSYGVAEKGSGPGARWRLPRTLLLPLRNASRRRGRLVRTAVTLGLAGSIFIGVLGVQRSLELTAEEYLQHYRYDLAVRFEQGQPGERVYREAAKVLGPAGTGSWVRTGATIAGPDGVPSPSYQLLALPPDSRFLRPQVMEGRWLEAGDTNAVVIDHTLLSNEPGLKVGSTVWVKAHGREHEWQVVGIVRGALTDTNLYVPERYYTDLAGLAGMVGELLVQVPDRDAAGKARLGEELRDHLNGQGLRVASLATAARTRTMIMTQFDLITAFLLAMSLLLALVGGIGLTGTLSMNTLERTREIGIMRATGASGGQVFFLVSLEAVLTGLAGWGLSALLSVPLTRLLARAVGMAFLKMPLPFSFSGSAVVLWFGLVMALSVSASLLPALAATRVRVSVALAHQ